MVATSTVKSGVVEKRRYLLTRIKNSKGFTLIELIVVIVIIGILAAIAAVAYTQFIANAEATSVETGADQIVRALNAEEVFTQADVQIASGSTFSGTTVEVFDKNANGGAGDYVPASDTLITDLNSAVNNNTLTITATNGVGIITLSDGSYECDITVPGLVKTCGNV